MKIRATILQRRHSPIRDEIVVDTRLELQWRDGESWHSFGIQSYGSLEWDFIVILMLAGARRMSVDFEQVDLTLEEVNAHA